MVPNEPVVRFWSLNHWYPTSTQWDPTPWSRFIYAPRGSLRITGEDNQWTLPPTHGFFVNPFGSYQVSVMRRTDLRIAYLHPSKSLGLPDGVRRLTSLLRELIREADRLAPLYCDDPIGNSLAILLSEHIKRAKPIDTVIPLPQDRESRSLARNVLSNPESALSEQLKRMSISRRTLERRFQHSTGMSLGQWHQRARLVQSVCRLEEGATVSEAAFAAGYVSPSAYIHVFRSHFGTTPGQFIERD